MDPVNSALDEYFNRRLAEQCDILEMAYKDRSNSSSSQSTASEPPIRNGAITCSDSRKQLKANGHCADNHNPVCRDTPLQVPSPSQPPKQANQAPNEFERCNRLVSFSVYMTWFILMVHAYVREFLRYYGFEENKAAVERQEQRDFAPLFSSFESVYARNCYKRVLDVFERPIGGVPGATVKILNRTTKDYCWSFQYTGAHTEIINVGSYNYLGFAENNGPCSESAAAAIDAEGLSVCTTVYERGMTATQHKLERLVAEFLGVEDAICFSMGFATNSMNTPCFVDKNSLIISDEYNHASLILGCRLSGAAIKVFKHNDMRSLENVIRNAIVYGNPKAKNRPYTKILIVVEGIYSMEGSISNLPAIIALKKKYNCYLYLDEAHSIGAMGPTGRGIVEYWGCDPADVDVLMGTFTKSFGAAGGYLAGSKKIIDHLRKTSPSGYYSLPMSPPVAQQIFQSMSTIMGKDGTNDGEQRIERLARNSRYFRLRLKQMGFIVYGSDDSPVVPIMLYYPTKCGLWGRQMLKRGIGVVVVSFPATEMTESRCRICISAAHTKEMLDNVLQAIDEVGDLSQTKHSTRSHLFQHIEAKW
ncbi:aminotransferase class I and II domain-containing protein [Ditylenchus destructor]|uniref:serine C-palmitoyltransferase n=1 Tax=Ditylenchus destructor TaxID=166010 RepID=A0AAD4NC51_9BILA|nr:aminotransferase class I and II domain-containing protein [Ditylenchus destructor]